MLNKGESTHRFDCNTVGPVPVASGYGSRTLVQSAAHMLNGSKETASALSLLNEKRLVQTTDNDLRELSETGVGVPETSENVDSTTSGVLRDRTTGFKTCCFTGSGPTRGSDANECGTQILLFTGSNLQSVKDGVLKRQNLFEGVAKFSSFTLAKNLKNFVKIIQFFARAFGARLFIALSLIK